jgi:hypothetical protein
VRVKCRAGIKKIIGGNDTRLVWAGKNIFLAGKKIMVGERKEKIGGRKKITSTLSS